MPTYIGLLKWTDQGVRNLKDTVTRGDQNRAAVEKAGGRLIGTWWTQGSLTRWRSRLVRRSSVCRSQARTTTVMAIRIGSVWRRS